jgi:F-type H+-transporting ATPase subunit b
VNINLTIIGQSITFIFFVWFCYAFVWSALRKMMEEREQQIADGLEAADRASRDLELAQDKVAQQLREAKQEAAAIIESANKRSVQIIEEAKEQAREEGNRLKAAAQAEIDLEINRAKEHLRQQVATLAIAGAEKILQTQIDANAHKGMVEKLAAGL